MQSTYHFIFSACTGVTLVLASCVLIAPLLAVVVAIACVGTAWALLRLDTHRVTQRREELADLRNSRGPRGQGVRT